MGFWAGFSNQMNINKEARARKEEAISAREFSAEQSEMDREQRRQEIADTLRQRRQEALVEAAASRNAVVGGDALRVGSGGITTTAVAAGGSGAPAQTTPTEGGLATDTGPTVSNSAIDGHYSNILLNDYGADPDKLAPFAALGESSMAEIYDAVDTARVAYVGADREAEFTSEVVNNILDGVRSTVKQGGTVQWEDLAAMAGLSDMSEEEKNWINLSLGGPKSTVKTTVLSTPPQFPLPIEDISKVTQQATGSILNTLKSDQAALRQKVNLLKPGEKLEEGEAEELSRVSSAIEVIEGNEGFVPNSVIREFGFEAILPYILNDPRLLRGQLGGPWDFAIENRMFKTEEEFDAAYRAGLIQSGTSVYIGGQKLDVGSKE